MRGDPSRDLARPARPPAGLRAWGNWLLRVAVSVVLLSFVIVRTDADRFSILVARINWGSWVFGLILVLLTPVASAQRVRMLIRGLGHRVLLRSVVAVNLEAMFFSLVIPGELVAGLVRWGRFSDHTRSRVDAFTLLAAERLIDWMVLGVVAAVGAPLLFSGESAPRLRAYTMAMATSVAVLGGTAALVGRSRFSSCAAETWRGRGRPRVGMEFLARLLGAGRALTSDARRTRSVLLWTGAYWSVAFVGTVVMARAVLPQMSVLPYVAATAVLALLTQIPLTVAGVGLRELSLPVLLGAYGVTDELGLVIGLSAFFPHALLGIAGVAVRLMGSARLEKEGP